MKQIKVGRSVFIFSLLIGIGLTLGFYLTSYSELLLVGYVFLAIAFIVNAFVFLMLLYKAMDDEKNRKGLLSTSGLLLVNIPIAITCIYFVMILLNTLRIEFVNNTGHELSDLNISGCQEIQIDKMMPGESKMIWIEIERECSISINYLQEGIRKEEVVAGYVTTMCGEKGKHRIDGKDKEIFL